MTSYNLPPEKNTPLPYGFDETDELVYSGACGVQKFYEDPDFIRIGFDKRSRYAYSLEWASELSAAGATEVLEDFIKASCFKKGYIALRSNVQDDQAIIGGRVNYLQGSARDILREAYESDDRVSNFRLYNRKFHLTWGPAWPMDFHDISINKIRLDVKKPEALHRFAIDQCIAATALSGLKADIDTVLDEFAQYESSLAL